MQMSTFLIWDFTNKNNYNKLMRKNMERNYNDTYENSI